jgi:mannosyltransferase OCH1-like enzyme
MLIPKLIHHTWKTSEIPAKWKGFRDRVIELHPGWEYKLWTDEENDRFVKEYFPDFYEIFIRFPLGIMRADVIRYLLMYKLGGIYLDLDYEFLRPFDFEDAKLVLPQNRSISNGDKVDSIGNAVFASVPGHEFWKDVIDDLKNNPPHVKDRTEVVHATGPHFLSRIYSRKDYQDILITPRMLFHPPSPADEKEYKAIVNNGISYGIHHGWGVWKKRYTPGYFVIKAKQILEKYKK